MSDEEPKKKSGSVLQWLLITVVMSLVSVAAGGFLGLQLVSQIKDTGAAAAKEAKAEAPPPKYGGGMSIVNLPPIVTNLADPPDAWVRLQAAIVFDTKAVPLPDVLAAQIAEDYLGFLKTLTVAQIGGASGLQHLREDLSERASIRSEGRIRELIIQSLVVQ
jgi:flagellar protein FliL